jgi:hypothetical protein
VTLRYPPAAMAGDYLRAAAGLGLTAGPALLLDLPTPALVVLVSMATLFGIFGVQVWRRHRARYRLTPEGITADPGGRRFPWARLEGLSLAWYSVRRDREEGWMELTLWAGGQRLRLDSRVEGFQELVRAASAAARAADLALDPRTLANLEALGVEAARAEPTE